jgi:HEPN domain-containing protein
MPEVTVQVNDGHDANVWLAEAKSYLIICNHVSMLEGVRPNSLCFLAHQVVEMAIKGILVKSGLDPNLKQFRSHRLVSLIDLLPSGINVKQPPGSLGELNILTEHALSNRYPGSRQKLRMDHYESALAIAHDYYLWAEKMLAL